MINGVTAIILTKADVLTGMDKIKVCTQYRINGKGSDQLPYDLSQPIEPVYEELPGWNENICGARNFDELPANLKKYIQFIEQHTGVPVKIVSVGPARDQIVVRE
jgi:adenylosuccinate synthase